MKLTTKKRIENIEKAQSLRRSRPRSAVVIYDPSITHFDIKSLPIDAGKVLVVPDDGNCCIDGKLVPKGSYQVTYSSRYLSC